jgi:bifunctional DNA-binding transcriptional regulator/antitoxin component of YhaV-PrlF toxin-antitoxin module
MRHTVEKITSKPQKVIRRISRGHQVTLPPHFLKENGLHIGDAVEILEEKGKVTIQPLTILGSQEKEHFIQKIQNLFDKIDHQMIKKELGEEEVMLNMINQEIEEFRK